MQRERLEKLADALSNDRMTRGEMCRDIADTFDLDGADRELFLRRAKALNEYQPLPGLELLRA